MHSHKEVTTAAQQVKDFRVTKSNKLTFRHNGSTAEFKEEDTAGKKEHKDSPHKHSIETSELSPKLRKY